MRAKLQTAAICGAFACAASPFNSALSNAFIFCAALMFAEAIRSFLE